MRTVSRMSGTKERWSYGERPYQPQHILRLLQVWRCWARFAALQRPLPVMHRRTFPRVDSNSYKLSPNTRNVHRCTSLACELAAFPGREHV